MPKTSDEAVAASTKYVKDHLIEIASGSREMVAQLAFLEGVLWLTQNDIQGLEKTMKSLEEGANAR